MKKHLSSIASLAILFFAPVAYGNAIETATSSTFSENSRTVLSTLVSSHEDVSALVDYALTLRNGKVDQSLQRDLTLNPVQVMDDCQLASLGSSEKLQILCRIDYTGRNRPTELIAIYKTAGMITHSTIAGGEGAYGIGNISTLIQDIGSTGRKEIVIGERRFRGLDGEVYSDTDPAPVVQNIYNFTPDGFVLSNSKFKSYFADVVLPDLVNRLNSLNAKGGTAEKTDQAQRHQKERDATLESITLTRRVIMFGHY